jgi:hypothetical protein
MIRLFNVALVAGVVAWATPSLAATWEASELYEECKDSGGVKEISCGEYLIGLMHGALIFKSDAEAPCVERYSGGQLRLIFLKWARDNPQYMNKHQSYVAMTSFREAFPCKSAKAAAPVGPERWLRQ